MTYPLYRLDGQILQRRKPHRAFELVQPAFFLQPVHQVRRNHQHFKTAVIQRSDGLAYRRLKIPAQHHHPIPAAHQVIALRDGFFQSGRAGELVGRIGQHQRLAAASGNVAEVALR